VYDLIDKRNGLDEVVGFERGVVVDSEKRSLPPVAEAEFPVGLAVDTLILRLDNGSTYVVPGASERVDVGETVLLYSRHDFEPPSEHHTGKYAEALQVLGPKGNSIWRAMYSQNLKWRPEGTTSEAQAEEASTVQTASKP